MDNITEPLKELLDKGMPALKDALSLSRGSIAYVNPNDTTVHYAKLSELEHYPDLRIGVGIFFDGSILPIVHGAAYSLYNLMKSLSISGEVAPTVLLCYRGMDSFKNYTNKPFRSIFITPEDFYSWQNEFVRLFSSFSINIAQFINYELLLSKYSVFKQNKIPVTFEVHNIEHILIGRLGERPDKVKHMRELGEKTMHNADYIFCRSEVDRDHAIELGALRSKTSVFNGGIYAHDFKYIKGSRPMNKIVFLGNMYYQPNENALDMLVTKVLSNLPSSFDVTVIGVYPKYMKRKYMKNNVCFKGWVANIDAELQSYGLAVAPIFEGSGTRLKLLDYLASGVAVITTNVGVEGLDPEISKAVIIEDNINKYNEHIKTIIDQPQKQKIRSDFGRKYVLEKYDWQDAAPVFVSAYKTLI